MDEFEIVPREAWGARFHDGFYDRKVEDLETWLHHSVTVAPDLMPPFTDDYSAIRTLDSIGESRFKGGISYTFAITPAGLIFEGHSIGRVGSHTQGHNTRGAGIVFVGNYTTTTPTPRMLQALTWLLHHGVKQGWWKAPVLTGGHRDTKSTACPGDQAYALIDDVNRGDFLTAEPVDNPIPIPAPAPQPVRPDVRALQSAVRAKADNVWGPITDTHFHALREASAYFGRDFPYGKAFAQMVVGATQDGVWGPRSGAAHDATVAGVQVALRDLGAYSGRIDGIWGPLTEAGFQSIRNQARI